MSNGHHIVKISNQGDVPLSDQTKTTALVTHISRRFTLWLFGALGLKVFLKRGVLRHVQDLATSLRAGYESHPYDHLGKVAINCLEIAGVAGAHATDYELHGKFTSKVLRNLTTSVTPHECLEYQIL